MLAQRDTAKMTDISIVIPSFNRQKPLYALVSALIGQHRSNISTELIVVLDGSTDGSAEALAKLTTPPEMRLIIHTQPNKGLAAARNAGLKLASGEVVLFLDDDIIPSEGLVRAYLHAYRVTGVDVVLGRIYRHVADWVPVAIADSEAYASEMRHKSLSIDGTLANALNVWGNDLLVKRSRLLEVGGFDEAFRQYGSEDVDLGQRLVEAGATFAYAPDAAVIHCYRGTPYEWRQRAWLRGRSEVALTTKHPSLAQHVAFGTLYDPVAKRRLSAQFAIQFPRLAMMLSAATFWVMPLARRLGDPSLSLQLANLSWLLAFWSGVRSKFRTAREVRTYYRSVTNSSHLTGSRNSRETIHND